MKAQFKICNLHFSYLTSKTCTVTVSATVTSKTVFGRLCVCVRYRTMCVPSLRRRDATAHFFIACNQRLKNMLAQHYFTKILP